MRIWPEKQPATWDDMADVVVRICLLAVGAVAVVLVGVVLVEVL